MFCKTMRGEMSVCEGKPRNEFECWINNFAVKHEKVMFDIDFYTQKFYVVRST